VPTTRFAPSPTGLLHLGHAFAALKAEKQAGGGTFLLRMEDLDATRSRAEFEVAIEEDLTWLGLSWPKPVLRQSQRLPLYAAAIDSLAAQGLIYPCFCTRRQIAAEIAQAAQAPHEPPSAIYPGTCRSISAQERARRIADGQSHALRFDAATAAARAGPLNFIEIGCGPAGESGEISVQPALLGDIVLARRDVAAAYHLAVVIDDAFQEVSLVTRGNDLFAATHVQRLLQSLLQLPVPDYAHHRLIVDSSGKKLSKRNGPATLQELRREGLRAAELRRQFGF
jgi:glutamyl-Q tRNA(Asp) synthetase